MKRYICTDPQTMMPDLDGLNITHLSGEWVRYEDVIAEIDRLKQWVDDCQSGMYINCVYCGHRYGPKEGTPVAMADVLKEHVEQCSAHPMSKLKQELTQWKTAYLDNEKERSHLATQVVPELRQEIRRLRFMVENGLGDEDFGELPDINHPS